MAMMPQTGHMKRDCFMKYLKKVSLKYIEGLQGIFLEPSSVYSYRSMCPPTSQNCSRQEKKEDIQRRPQFIFQILFS